MRKRLIYAILLSVVGLGYGQELPKIVPPSPQASSFQVYGNTQVNNYTGSANVSIPIFTIKEGDLSLPIYLKYTGGNGIKVEEIASWTGLGWTLNAGGSISRTIRGVADEDPFKLGFLKRTSGVPHPTAANANELNDMAANLKDSEPDKFMYNFMNGSGSFFYDHNSNIYFKPMSKINVSYTEGVDPETPYSGFLTTGHSVIKDFTIKDEYGNSFFFDEKERSNTFSYTNYPNPPTFSDTRGFPSTWYIKKIKNRIGKDSINFEYDPFNYKLKRLQTTISDNLNQLSYTSTAYISKRLKKITYSGGSVEFIASSANRKDLENNKYLDYILIKDMHGNTIKRIQFKYKYMTPTGLVDVNTSLTYSESNRLILTAIQECADGGVNCKPETKFTYDTTHLLPARDSKAQDHWGYYNGQNSNTTLEPKHYAVWANGLNSTWTITPHGSANREPSFAHTKSGVLTQIEHATGGKSVFNYESHTAVSNKVSGVMSNLNIKMNNPGAANKVPFTVSLYSEPNPKTKLYAPSVGTSSLNPPLCGIRIHIEKNGVDLFSLSPSSNPMLSPILGHEKLIESGTYHAWYELESGCTQGPELTEIVLAWYNESSSPTKTIGGLRLESIVDYSDATTVASKRNFNYNGDTGVTSGRIVNAPRYYGIRISPPPTPNSPDIFPVGYDRYVNSAVPLGVTQGSHVGYGKVTVTRVDTQNNDNGKEEFYYTTADIATGYTDNSASINPYSGSPYNLTYQGRVIEGYPRAETDSRDFVRGTLTRHIISKRTGSTYDTIQETINTNDLVSFSNSALNPGLQYIGNFTRTVRGIKVRSNGYLTYYDIYSGYNLPSQTITKRYNAGGMLQETTTQDYDRNGEGFATHFVPIKSTFSDSQGITHETQTTYVFNKTSKTAAEAALETQKAIYLPLKTKSIKGGIKLSEQYTVYSNFSGDYLPGVVQASKGNLAMEDRIVYHSYYANGNVKEVSKKDGTRIVYIWGYNESIPVAKIEGANFSDIPTATYNSILTASNADNDISANEGALRTALNALRSVSALSSAQITTFTYDPLVGVTSITDPRGQVIYYKYDAFNRLVQVIDQNGHIVSENQYHYKN